MYSRNRMMSAEERYGGNVPPVYGGNRFYRSGEGEIRAEDVRAAVPEEGIPAAYEAPPKTSAVYEPPEEESAVSEICESDFLDTKSPDPPKEEEARPLRLASLLGDREEMLLLGLLILLLCEEERAPDVIVILLLLLTIR